MRPETRARGWHRHRWTRRSHRVCTPDWPLNRARHAAIVHLGTDVRHLVNVDFRVERSVRRWGPTRRRSPVSRATHPRTLCGCPYRRGHEDAAPYADSRARCSQVLDSVVNDREEVVITRAGHEPVVLLSLAYFQSLRETAYLMGP